MTALIAKGVQRKIKDWLGAPTIESGFLNSGPMVSRQTLF
jgi:hypothetical protein